MKHRPRALIELEIDVLAASMNGDDPPPRQRPPPSRCTYPLENDRIPRALHLRDHPTRGDALGQPPAAFNFGKLRHERKASWDHGIEGEGIAASWQEALCECANVLMCECGITVEGHLHAAQAQRLGFFFQAEFKRPHVRRIGRQQQPIVIEPPGAAMAGDDARVVDVH